MRAWISRVNSSKRACSSGVIFRGFLFAIVAVLQDSSDLADVFADVSQHRHDSREVAILDRHDVMLAVAGADGKMAD
jgi:hypothetical protein